MNGLNTQSLNIAKRSGVTVLITGETGTGKTVLAREIHEGGERRGRAFVTVNLATLHEGLIESELFGHERGAFTGAESKRIGKLELALGGTVFLDEIGDLPLRLQARLLEFLQSKTVCPVGGNRQLTLDVRVIAATHRNLESMVAKGLFREDLFHRLRVLSIPLPSLRDRRDRFDEILHDCLNRICTEANRSVLRISEEVASRLEAHEWPGNFRELRNVLEYAVLSSDQSEISARDLPPWFFPKRIRDGGMSAPVSSGFYEAMACFEKTFLREALDRNSGQISETARQIGMNKTTLLRRLRLYGLGNQSVA